MTDSVSGPMTVYRARLKSGAFRPDEHQALAVEMLQLLHGRLARWRPDDQGGFLELIGLAKLEELPKGLYFYGGVGRGKSALMDLFFDIAPVERKRRVHFHAFMLEIHGALHEMRKKASAEARPDDLIKELARRVARKSALLCFDEFDVTDIADAMILGRFLEQVMARGVEFVMTSNYHPDRLYENGLQRERFLPAIELLKEQLDVVEVDGGTDYRRLKMEKLKVYHVGDGVALEKIFQELKDVEEEKHPLDVEGRQIRYRKRAGGLVWFEFEALCGGPRSYADYVDLARRFHTVILSNVPKMSAKESDAARRFTWLVDVFYDDRVKLIVSAAAQPEDLFTDGGENAKTAAAEFQRTASRLHEMQSVEYLKQERARR